MELLAGFAYTCNKKSISLGSSNRNNLVFKRSNLKADLVLLSEKTVAY